MVSGRHFSELSHGRCDDSEDFMKSLGDIDAGRNIYQAGCSGCHGVQGDGGIASALTVGKGESCHSCQEHAWLSKRIQEDMPPEGYCDAQCAKDVAAFIQWQFIKPLESAH